MTRVTHGGRLDEAVALHGGSREKWLDLSTGINANGWPVKEALEGADKGIWQHLPDDVAWEDAASAVRAAYRANDKAAVSLAPGSQMHIQLLPLLYKPQNVAVVGFSYQEHGVCWQRAGHQVFMTDGLESAERTARIIIVVNPNNPDGRIIDRHDLINLSRRLGPKGGLLVVDEAFADVAPRSSISDQAGRDGLLVLRSLGKFYGLAGLRFGAALTTRALAGRLEERLGPWAVSGPALHLAAAALRDDKWRKRTLTKLQAGRDTLEDMLLAQGHEVVGGTALYVLSRNERAEELNAHLLSKHILVRTFPGQPTWLRFGIPANKTAFNKLEKALKEFHTLAEEA